MNQNHTEPCYAPSAVFAAALVACMALAIPHATVAADAGDSATAPTPDVQREQTNQVFEVPHTSRAARVTGRVLDSEGAALAGVVVDVPALELGTTTDADGRFELRLPPGLHRLRVWRLDHERVERVVSVSASTHKLLVFELQRRDLVTDAVVVTADRIDDVAVPEPGRYVMRSETVQDEIGSFDDIMRSVQSLPGVARPSDYHGEFFVRGAGAHANAVYLDGIPIFFPYHILGFNSIFNPGLVESAEFYAGGAPAAYGGGTGGVMLIRSRGASPPPYRADLGLSYMAGHVRAGGGTPDKGWVLSARRSYHDKLARLINGDGSTQIPSFYDAMLRARWRPSERHLLLGGVLAAGDGLSIFDPEASALRNDLINLEEGAGLESNSDRLSLDNRLLMASMAWRAVLGSQAYLETTLGYVPQRLRFSLHGENRESVDIDTRLLTLREDLTLHRRGHKMRFGWETYRTETEGLVSAYAAFVNLRQSNSSLNLDDQQERYLLDLGRTRWYLALYGQDSWVVADERLEIAPGLRYEHDGLTGEHLWSPRLALSYRPRLRWQLRGTWGVHHTLRNTPMEVQPTRDGAPLGAEHSHETTLSVTRSWDAGVRANVTAYRKTSSNLVFESEPAYFSNGARGRAHGLETWLDWEPSSSGFRARAQYVWSEARQHDSTAWRRRLLIDPQSRDEVWRAVDEQPYWYSPMQDQPHRLAVDARWRVRAWEFGARLQVASGLPLTPVETVHHDSEGTAYGVVGLKGSQRLPLYKRLDLRLLRHFHSRNVDWRVYAEVLNATAANNVYMLRWNRDYTQEYSVQMLPLLPTLGIEASF